MTKKWPYILAAATVITLGFLCSDTAQAKYVDSKSLTLALSIEKHYEVAFNANGGTGSMANQQFTAGEAQTLSANTFTNSGSFFASWNTAADGSGTTYTDQELITTDLTNIGGDIVTLYAQWGEDAMRTVFKIDGTCVFHGYDIQQHTGDGHITGTNCTAQGINWADGTHKYIDTGVKLYDSTNYMKDYEVGFTITNYDYSNQYIEPGDNASQATFFNTKLENEARHWPGLVVRKSAEKVEITETIKKQNGSYEKKTAYGTSTTPVKIVVARIDGIIYSSVNDGAFTKLQDLNDTTDYFDVNAWFGAAAKDNGIPMRYIDATMTDIYIKLGDKGANKHIVSFDAGGVVTDPSDVTVLGARPIGNSMPSMPSYVDTSDGRLYFIGWYSGIDGTGDKYDASTVINHDVTLHAFWNDEPVRCRVNDETHGTLQGCVNAANAGDTITLLEDMREHLAVANGKEVILDLNGLTLRDNNGGNNPVIENSGKLTVINGTITSTLQAGVLNNTSTGELYIGNDARIVATGTRQAIYNNGGKLEISGNAYLSASTSQRAAVHNLANGTVEIKGGTIISTGREAVLIESGSLTIGVEDGTIDSSTPILQGATYGLSTSVDVSMYDGKLRGKTAAINNTSRITTTETGATPVGISPEATEVIDGATYKIIYYE